MAEVLVSLIRMKRWQVDEKRRTLAELSLRVENLAAEADRLEQEIACEQTLVRAKPEEVGIAYGPYAHAIADRRMQLARSIADAEADRAEARERLRQAFLDLKTLEIAHANRARQRMEEAERRERVVLDETALQRHERFR